MPLHLWGAERYLRESDGASLVFCQSLEFPRALRPFGMEHSSSFFQDSSRAFYFFRLRLLITNPFN